MAISNELKAKFYYDVIDNKYDFYEIRTSDKYINKGASILDKPIEQMSAESIVFDNGNKLMIMFPKNRIDKYDLIRNLEDKKLSITKKTSTGLKPFILLRLFLFSLSNFDSEELKFNNITGNFYITNSGWMAKDKKSFRALKIDIDENFFIKANAKSFTKCSEFTNQKKIIDYPKYSFEDSKGFTLKRSFDNDFSNLYVARPKYPTMKASIPFFNYSSESAKKNSKASYIYKTIGALKTKFQGCIEIEFKEIVIDKQINKYKEKEMVDKCVKSLNGQTLNLINWSNSSEFDSEFNQIKEMLSTNGVLKVITSNKVDNSLMNLVYLHDKQYYIGNGYNDPYINNKNNAIIQHITIEDCADKLVDDVKAVFNTILKELYIKMDIVKNSKITIDNWGSFNFKDDFIVARAKEAKQFFMIVKSDGSFKFIDKFDDFTTFESPILKECSNVLTNNNKKLLIAYKGNILLIDKTNRFNLPLEETLSMNDISRSQDSLEKYFNGIYNINLYNIDGKVFYNAGIRGSGVHANLPTASPLYSVEVIKGENIICEILETMSVTFVRYNDFTVMPYPFKYLNEHILMTGDK